MKALLINPFDMSVSQIEVGNANKSFYETLSYEGRVVNDINIVMIGLVNNVKIGVIVDGEGLLILPEPPHDSFFRIDTYGGTFCGMGLVLGFDEAGETVPCPINVSELYPHTSFPRLRFLGFEVTSGIEDHPVWGPTHTIRQDAKFEEVE